MRAPVLTVLLIMVVALAGCSGEPDETENAGPETPPAAAASTPFDCSQADQGEWMEHNCGEQTPAGPATYPPSTTATWTYTSPSNCTGTFVLASMDDEEWLSELNTYLVKRDPDHEWVPARLDLDNSKGSAECAPHSITVVTPEGEQIETEDPGEMLEPEDAGEVDAYNSLIDHAVSLQPGAKGTGYLFFRDEPPAWTIAYVDVEGFSPVPAEQV